jgi:hypothetical protein
MKKFFKNFYEFIRPFESETKKIAKENAKTVELCEVWKKDLKVGDRCLTFFITETVKKGNQKISDIRFQEAKILEFSIDKKFVKIEIPSTIFGNSRWIDFPTLGIISILSQEKEEKSKKKSKK